jgi:hypothetical protein
MKKVSLTIFLLMLALFVQASEKLLLLVEDGFSEFLKQDFHRLAICLSQKFDCKLTSIPETGVQPVLRISTVKESGNYKSVLFAVRGNLFLVNAENPVEGLTSGDLQQIFSGTFRKWNRTSVPLKQICYYGNGKIVPAGLEKGSVPWIRFPGPDLALRMVADDMTALGIIPIVNADVSVDGTRCLPVDGVAATPESVITGKYPGVKLYYLSIRNDAPEEIQKLYKKLLSKQTRIKLLNAGILPVVKGD